VTTHAATCLTRLDEVISSIHGHLETRAPRARPNRPDPPRRRPATPETAPDNPAEP
jgi:hypothetical protein